MWDWGLLYFGVGRFYYYACLKHSSQIFGVRQIWQHWRETNRRDEIGYFYNNIKIQLLSKPTTTNRGTNFTFGWHALQDSNTFIFCHTSRSTDITTEYHIVPVTVQVGSIIMKGMLYLHCYEQGATAALLYNQACLNALRLFFVQIFNHYLLLEATCTGK